MSQQNVEIVRAALDAYDRGDLEALLKTRGSRLRGRLVAVDRPTTRGLRGR